MQNMNIYRGNFLDDKFDEHAKNVWCVDKFDVIVMNPPYQELLSGGNRMKSIYNDFIEKALYMTEKLISIHPSRWMASQVELRDFRNRIVSSKKIKFIKHFDNSQEVFGKMVDIEGGVQYFLIDSEYNGDTEINGETVNLLEFDIIPTNLKSFDLIRKINKIPNLSLINKSKMQFGIKTNDKRFVDEKIDKNFIKCYVSKQKGFEKYIDINQIKNDSSLISFKVITARANGGKKSFGNKFIGFPNEVWCGSYVALEVKSKKEAESLISYMDTKFCNFMLGLRKNTQDIKPDTMKWIPLVPFDRIWTDEMLFEYFNLTEEEKELIFFVTI
jgi:site-specific DNA-methyltransferase (adenine-specific)